MAKIFKVSEKYSDITGTNANSFGKDLVNLEKSIEDDILIDFSGVGSISSIGIGTLFATYRKMLSDGRKLSVINAGEKNKRMLQMLNMSDIIDDENK